MKININTSHFTRTSCIASLAVAGLMANFPAFSQQSIKKNVLFIMADDFNSWNGLNNYYPLVKTPNIDKLARKGVYFSDGHCSSPVCNPSRNSLWSGVRPSTSGIMGNGDGYIRTTAGFENITTMHQYFKQNGYYTLGGGKLYHSGSMGGETTDPTNWFELYREGTGSQGGPFYKYNSPSDALFAWSAGVYDINTASDTKLANFMANKISNYDKSENKNQPFFIGCGFFRPHLPLNTHKQFWDLFADSSVVIPKGYKADDLKDIPEENPAAIFTEIKNAGKWTEFIHAYLAGLAYADYNIGIVLDALEKSALKNNTIVCFMGDHGWQLGEKSRFCKYAHYDQAYHTTLIIYDPSAEGNGKVCKKVVSMQDLYPTLLELCNLPVKTDVEGRSVVPLLQNPDDKNWNWPILMSFNSIHVLKNNAYRFVSNGDRSQFYDMTADPYEWTNLYTKTEYKPLIAKMQLQLDSIRNVGQQIKAKILNKTIFTPKANVIPGIIEAENYDEGANSQTYYDADNTNSGRVYRADGVDIVANNDDKGAYCIDDCKPKEWLQYTVSNFENGVFNISLRCKNPSSENQFMKLYTNNQLIGRVTVQPTGNNWITVGLNDVALSSKTYLQLKIEFETAGLQFNYMQFDKKFTLNKNGYYQNSSKKVLQCNQITDNQIRMDLTYTNMQVRMTVYDISGKHIFSDDIMGEEKQDYSIKQKMVNGYYLLTINDGEQYIVEKFKIIN